MKPAHSKHCNYLRLGLPLEIQTWNSAKLTGLGLNIRQYKLNLKNNKLFPFLKIQGENKGVKLPYNEQYMIAPKKNSSSRTRKANSTSFTLLLPSYFSQSKGRLHFHANFRHSFSSGRRRKHQAGSGSVVKHLPSIPKALGNETMKHPKATNHKTPVSMETKAQESTLKEECQNEFGERVSSHCLANADKVSGRSAGASART